MSKGFDTFEEAEAYAKKLMEPVSIMYGKNYIGDKEDSFHVIREFGVAHWKQHLKEVAVCTPGLVVTRV